jgi:acyl-CoA thioester hydrolase
VHVATQILGNDSKRLHLAHEMFSLASEARAATQELMYLHIDLGARRVVPWLPEARERVDAAAGGIPGSSDPTGPGAASRCRRSCKGIERRSE